MSGQESYDLSWRLYEALGSSGFSLSEIRGVISKVETKEKAQPVMGKRGMPKGSKNVMPQAALDRLKDMARSYESGQTLEQIGSEYGISRERVRQVLRKYGVTRLDGGQHVIAQVRAEEREGAKYEKRASRLMAFWGVTPEEMHELNDGKNVSDPGGMALAYRNQWRSAELRSIPWEFNFRTWLDAWKASGKLTIRGRGKGKYAMGRKGDKGPYSPENVVFITNEENARDARLRSLSQRGNRDELGLTPKLRIAHDLIASGVDTARGIADAMGITYCCAYSYMKKVESIKGSSS